MNKFEELLAKYGKTADEVTFEYENLSDEELEVAFKEAFEEVEEEAEPVVEETVVEDVVEETVVEEAAEEVVEETAEVVVEESAEEPAEEVAEEAVEEVVETEENFTLRYELSHDDIRSALYTLLDATGENGYYYTWIIEVFDDKFIYQDYMEGKFYRQGYTREGDNVALSENKVEVFNEWLSKSEKDALDALKADYAALKEFKANADAAKLQADKDAIFAREEFSAIVETKAFKKLVENSIHYTIEECEQRAKEILDDCNDYVTNFAAQDNGTNKTNALAFNFNKKESKKGPYGNLFNKD